MNNAIVNIKLPKFGITYIYHKDGTVIAKRGFIKPKYKTCLQSHTILNITLYSANLEISINLPVAYIDEIGNDVAITALYGL